MTLEWLITWHELSLQKTLHKLRQVNATVLDELPSYQTAAIVVALAEKKCILMYIAVLGIVLGKTICSLAFNQRTMPELSGSVTAISAITVVDESSGFAFFRVGLAIPPDDLAKGTRTAEKATNPQIPVY